MGQKRLRIGACLSTKLWQFAFDGVYLGGTAIVCADSEIEAKQLLASTLTPRDFDSLQLETSKPITAGVVYLDNGDY